jgi:hypothetical protein
MVWLETTHLFKLHCLSQHHGLLARYHLCGNVVVEVRTLLQHHAVPAKQSQHARDLSVHDIDKAGPNSAVVQQYTCSA